MNHKTFFENFELLVDAPNSVEELRELILQLAVKGKLVPQDPNEETASVFLEKIIADKKRLIKEKKFKKSQTLPEIEKDEVPFGIPKTWKWIRLNDVGDWGAGSTPDRKRPEYYEGSILWFKSGELNDGYIYDSDEKITEDALKDCSLRLDKPGDVLIAMYGATIGKVAILEVEATTNQAVCACTCFSGIYNCYLFYLLKAYRRNFSNQGAGGAQPNISRHKIIHTVAPLAPYEEQQRIVAKVDQLMALCDELEARQQKKHEQRIRLNNAALDKLLTAPMTEEFAQHCQRICDNFDLLYDVPETVGQLRQAILQLAVQGKLVPQDPEDEQASVLLEKIIVNREQLIKNKKISKSKSFLPINRDKVPYELPNGWEWIRFEDTAKKVEYGTSQKSTPDGPGVPVLRMNNIQKGKMIYENLKYIPKSIKDLPRLYLKHNDILFNRTNSYELVGKTAIYKGESETFSFASYLIRASLFIDHLVPDYINIVLNSDFFRKTQIEPEITQQCGQANFNGTKLKNSLIPLPPRNEQKRIVAKVDQLMALCDELEAGLEQAQTEGGKLMEAVVHHVLAG